MEINITKQISLIQIKEERDFITMELNDDKEIIDITSNFPFETGFTTF